MKTKVLLFVLAIAVTGALASAQMLHPEMKLAADAGTYAAPMAKIGETPQWSSTTIEAAVDKKPNPGKVEKITGEVVDFSCYMQLGKHGEAHTACAKKCFGTGQPIALLTKTGLLYVIMEEEHHPRRDGQTSFREEMTKHTGHVLEVTGMESVVAGQRALFVSGFVKK